MGVYHLAGVRSLPPSSVAPGSSSLRPFRRRGFTLIETAFAIGIVAFAFVALIGLLPAGLTNFREAMDPSVGAQIGRHRHASGKFLQLTGDAARAVHGLK